MPSLKFTRVVFAVIVFAVWSSNILAQPKYPSSVRNTWLDKNLSAELNKQYFEKEIAEADKLIASNPNDSGNYWRRGYFKYLLGTYNDALKDVDKAIKLNGKNDVLYNLRGHIFFGENSFAEAEKDFNKALELNPKNSDSSRMLTLIREFYNKKLEQIRILDSQIAQRPKNPELYTRRGEIYSAIGKLKEAEDDAKKAEEINAFMRKDVAAECDLRSYLCHIDFYNRKIEIVADFDYPDNLGKYYSGRAAGYFDNGNYEDAFKDLNAVIEGFKWTRKVKDRFNKDIVDVKSSPVQRDYAYRGAIYFRKGLYAEALKDLQNSAGIQFPENYVYMGEIYRTRKEYLRALGVYEIAIEYNRRSARAYYGRAMVYLKIGDDAREIYKDEEKAVEAYNKAVKDFDSVIEIDLLNTDSGTYLQRARIYERLGETDKAAADIAKAREIEENP